MRSRRRCRHWYSRDGQHRRQRSLGCHSKRSCQHLTSRCHLVVIIINTITISPPSSPSIDSHLVGGSRHIIAVFNDDRHRSSIAIIIHHLIVKCRLHNWIQSQHHHYMLLSSTCMPSLSSFSPCYLIFIHPRSYWTPLNVATKLKPKRAQRMVRSRSAGG